MRSLCLAPRLEGGLDGTRDTGRKFPAAKDRHTTAATLLRVPEVFGRPLVAPTAVPVEG